MKRRASLETDEPSDQKKVRVEITVNQRKRTCDAVEDLSSKKIRLSLKTLSISHMTPAYTIRDPSQSVEIIVDSVTHYVPRRMYIHIRTDMCPYSTVELMSPNFDTLIIEEHNDWLCDTSARTTIAGVTYENGRLVHISSSSPL